MQKTGSLDNFENSVTILKMLRRDFAEEIRDFTNFLDNFQIKPTIRPQLHPPSKNSGIFRNNNTTIRVGFHQFHGKTRSTLSHESINFWPEKKMGTAVGYAR